MMKLDSEIRAHIRNSAILREYEAFFADARYAAKLWHIATDDGMPEPL